MTPSQYKKLRRVLTEAHAHYAGALRTHAHFKIHDRTTGDDLVQDTFIKTWSYLVKNGKVESMRAFLYHVLNGLVIDEYRKRKTVSLDVLLEKGFEPSVDDSTQHFDAFDAKEAMALIDKLPEPYRKIMHMRYVQHLTLKEIATLTGQTKNTVTVQAHRGLTKLKALYHSQA